MLSIAKLRVGQEAYQLTGVAQSLDDYYTGDGEAPGVWMGTAAERLGLGGEVAPDDLRAVLAGIAPGSGGLSPDGTEIRPHPRRVPGFDLCFKAPKSLSVLYAVTDDPRVQGAIVEAGDAAVRETLGWLEREGLRVRRGTANERWLADIEGRDPGVAAQRRVRVLPAAGMAAAAFRHRTSRAGDPLLHWHVLVPNLVEGPDGRWSALVHPELYRHVRAAGEVFQAAVRAETTERLGLRWRPGRHVPEVAGVPQALCDGFSKRSREVEAWLAATGTPDDAAGRQEAVLATRRHKPELEGQRFDAAWKAEALAAGWGPERADELVTGLHHEPQPTDTSSTTPAPPPTPDPSARALWRLPEHVAALHGATGPGGELVEPDEWVRILLDTELTMPDATFTRPQLAQHVAAWLGQGATVATVEQVCARVLASPHVVPVADVGEHDGRFRGGVERWTSRDHLDREGRLLAAVDETRSGRQPLPAGLADTATERRPSLGEDQLDAVRTLTRTSDGVSVLVGPAGTGKTHVLATVRETYEQAGYQTRGAAPSARAALGLTGGAGIPSVTLHRLLHDWSHGVGPPGPATVLVVDEAGMAATRELEPAVTAVTSAGGRVILVGDHHQLPAVTAGGGFAALATGHQATVATLTHNRRQVHLWERTALTALRAGDVSTAVAAYQAHGRIVAAEDRTQMIDQAVDRWFTARTQGEHAVLLTGTNNLVDTLNAAVRRELVTRGELPAGPALTWADRDFTAGDRVVMRHNSYDEQLLDGSPTVVVNGEVGTIADGGPAGLAVRMDTDGRTVAVRGDFIAAGHLDHAYALTVSRAQGGTWDVAIGVGLDGLYREAGYTQLSRGTEANWLILTTSDLDQIDHLDVDVARHDTHAIPLPSEQQNDDPDARLTGRLQHSRAKQLALARDPQAAAVADLADTTPLAALEARARHRRHIEDQATRTTGGHPAALAAQLDRLHHTAKHLAAGQQVKAHDRGNIGTLLSWDDHTGIAEVHFRAADGRETTRTISWDTVEVLDHPQERPHSPAARATLERLQQPLQDRLDRWHTHIAAHGVQPGDAARNQRAADLAIDRATRHLAHTQPGWLHHLLGHRPDTPQAATVWDDATRTIAAHRLRHHIPEDIDGLGPPPPATSTARTDWEAASAQTARARIWLDTHTPRPTIPVTRTRSTNELHQRRHQLEAVFATAPADQRPLIDRLRAGDLTSPDTLRLLDAALDTQGQRRQWILTHWPHIVEHAEITRTLQTHTAGPDIADHMQALQNQPGPLGQAATTGETWLTATLGHVIPPDATTIDSDTLDLLDAIANHRQRWNITHPDPLGPAADTDHQATERARLTHWIDDHITPTTPRPSQPSLPGLDLQPERPADLQTLDEGLAL